MVGKDLIMATLFGSGGGSSGSGGGGSAGVSPKEVNFYDYDGTCVHAYTVAEAQALSELPAGPEHPGLVFQGWNWSLEGVKGLTRAMNIGAMYTTDDGTTRLYITLQEGRTSPMLGVGVNGTVTVDWGDGTEPDVLTGTSVGTTKWTPNHAYAKPGDYVIRLTVDGEMVIQGNANSDQGSSLMRFSSGADARNVSYQQDLKKVEIGNSVVAFGNAAFQLCYSLSTISMPNCVKNFNSSVFNNCYSLAFVTVPIELTRFNGGSVFNGCASIKLVSMPEHATNSGSEMFKYCYSMMSACIPDGVTAVESNEFYGCYSLRELSLPKNLTRINQSALNSCYSLGKIDIPESVNVVEMSAFMDCRSLVSLTFADGISSFAYGTFYRCYSMLFFDFTAFTAVPSLASAQCFTNIPADCEIRVPAALYDEWIAATNWATYADYIKAY